MIGAIARKLFGSANDRRIKGYQPRVAAINALEKRAGEALRRRTARAHRGFQEARRLRHHARRHSGRGLRDGARGRQARHRPAPFRRAVDRRHDPARGLDRRDEDRRRQDAGRDAAGLSQCAVGPRRPRGDGQRLPRQARFRVDGPDLQFPRPDGRRHRARPRRRGAQEAVRLRRHLRHQQRTRLRLPARQHEVPAGGHGPARACLRDRRRGRLDPDRRGAHAADHLRSARRPLRVLQHHRRLHPQAGEGRLRDRREAAHGRR